MRPCAKALSNACQGAFLDLSSFAVGLAQEDGGFGVTVGDDMDVHAYHYAYLTARVKSIHRYKHAYKSEDISPQ